MAGLSQEGATVGGTAVGSIFRVRPHHRSSSLARVRSPTGNVSISRPRPDPDCGMKPYRLWREPTGSGRAPSRTDHPFPCE